MCILTVSTALTELLAEVLRLQARTQVIARLVGVVAGRVVVPAHTTQYSPVIN